jgi:hypothetical protein
MIIQRKAPDYVERRARLIAELMLEDLGAAVIARHDEADFLFDYLAGFKNAAGGMNTIGVELKAVEGAPGPTVELTKKVANRIAGSNTPTLLLVIDVKHNQLWYAWSNDLDSRLRDRAGGSRYSIPVRELTEEAQVVLKGELSRSVKVAS